VAAPADGGDPAHESAGDARRGGDLMSYGELYALWERQNWRAHELDFSADREQWLASPTEAQQHTMWSLGSFYIGEERVTADLAPFLLAAPSGEVEAFLATQLVDEARHAVFFDRFGAEVMALDSDDLRGRLAELQALMEAPWFDVFDDGLRDIADRIKAAPHDFDLFVEGITTYHLIIEGVLAMTGQRFILKYMEDHGLYPGFQKGFSLVEQDEHRHIAFGVRFLKDAVQSDPARYGAIVQRRVEELVPRAAGVFVPPYVDNPREFMSYGYHSSHVYGFAYRKLKRRMAVLGLDVPPPEDLMPGPIASPEEARAAGAPV
jgi:ribonucleoside-diphosphate reductase beta chain